MRKVYKQLIPVSLVLLALVGCGNEGNEPDANGSKSSPDFTATISDSQSRAYNQKWNNGDEIGISGCGRSNVCYVTNDGDGTFTVKHAGEQIYFQDNNSEIFTAYYPWNTLAGGATTISAETKNQLQQADFDFLWAQGTGSKNSPNVNLGFAHKMVKVVLNVRPGTGMSFDEIKSAKLSLAGFSHNGTFDVTDGSTTVGAVSEPWTFSDLARVNEEDKILTFSFILFPQKFNDSLDFAANIDKEGGQVLALSAKIDFTSANSEKDKDKAQNEWVDGRQYNLSLTLNKTEIVISKCDINPWNVVSGNEIIVD